jgi:hypothetical protein
VALVVVGEVEGVERRAAGAEWVKGVVEAKKVALDLVLVEIASAQNAVILNHISAATPVIKWNAPSAAPL